MLMENVGLRWMGSTGWEVEHPRIGGGDRIRARYGQLEDERPGQAASPVPRAVASD